MTRRELQPSLKRKRLPDETNGLLSWNVFYEGGRFLDQAPCFTPDESHVLLATEETICSYSVKSSRLVARVSLSEYSPLTSMHVLKRIPSRALAASADGKLFYWNWTDGSKPIQSDASSQIWYSKTFLAHDDLPELIIAISGERGNCLILLSTMFNEVNGTTTVRTILKHDKSILAVEAYDCGRILIAMTRLSILVGKLNIDEHNQDYNTWRYKWAEFRVPEYPHCFDAIVNHAPIIHQAESSKNSSTRLVFDIAIGGHKGCIFWIRDIFDEVHFGDEVGQVSATISLEHLVRLHWHRSAPSVVKWSNDGKYLISGGKETTLVHWHMDSGTKGFLPNLESPIKSLSISRSGALYALQLCDNSVLILSTSELTTIANFSSLQSISFNRIKHNRIEPPLKEMIVARGSECVPRLLNVLIHPQDDHKVLLTTGHAYDTDVSTSDPPPMFSLQAFDISTQTHLGTQALTWTNLSGTNIGPEGDRIHQPRVDLITLSESGRWLATVDCWESTKSPPNVINPAEEAYGHPINYREINLRIWTFDIHDRFPCELHTRIRNPHSLDHSSMACNLLDLKADPSQENFATIGADSVLRIWGLRGGPRSISGTATDANGDADAMAYSNAQWLLLKQIGLGQQISDGILRGLNPTQAIIAYSNDGSMIVINQTFRTDSQWESARQTYHSVDPRKHPMKEIHSGLDQLDDDPETVIFMEILDQVLILLRQSSILLWNITNGNKSGLINLSGNISSGSLLLAPMLAVDLRSQTFAVTTSHKMKRHFGDQNQQDLSHLLQNYTSSVQVFSLSSKTPLKPEFSGTLPRLALSLTSACGRKRGPYESPEDLLDVNTNQRGFVVVDAGGFLRRISLSSVPSTESLTPRGIKAETARFMELQDSSAQTNTQEHSLEKENNEPLQITPDLVVEQMETQNSTSNLGEEELTHQPMKFETHQPPDPPIVRTEDLAKLFDYPGHTAQHLDEMYTEIIRLFARRNRSPLGSTKISPISERN